MYNCYGYFIYFAHLNRVKKEGCIIYKQKYYHAKAEEYLITNVFVGGATHRLRDRRDIFMSSPRSPPPTSPLPEQLKAR